MRTDARPGLALFSALLALALVGTMFMAGFFAVRTEWEEAGVALRVAQLDAASAAATSMLLATWDSSARFAQSVGYTVPVALPPTLAGTTTEAWASRLSSATFRVSIRVRDLRQPSLTSQSVVLLHVAAPVLLDSLMAGTAADSLGGVPLSRLRELADVRMDTSGAEPSPVGNICYSSRSLVLTGGRGRGVLIVEGRLTLAGPVDFEGVIFATSGIEVASPGVTLTGALVTGGEFSGKYLNDMKLTRDTSLVGNVLWHAGRLELPTSRWWWRTP